MQIGAKRQLVSTTLLWRSRLVHHLWNFDSNLTLILRFFISIFARMKHLVLNAGGLKHFGALNEHYEGTVSAREKVLYGGIVTALATRTLLSPLERIKTYMMVRLHIHQSF